MGRPFLIHRVSQRSSSGLIPAKWLVLGLAICKKELMALFGPYSVLFWHFL